ncbi:ABC transporter G family member 23-like [Macrosteles quadrilineatus]|uniref:ABC transporter G family member 23-like n=1 Tax=Macrosteles quadrilineatus TaxID=74068 RepID=UPI0023E126E4|nr:ABC transporter G family member 23-like [Macrosteles quadrilineatus]
MFETIMRKTWETSSNTTTPVSGNSAIEIRDAFMRYDSTAVFQGLNMTVQQGTIYGLLGPSGCGKTTLLNCITGITTLHAGTIFVKCQHQKQIGYMPQETALMEKFTISEVLHYFGKIYEMDCDEVDQRAKLLLNLVDLSLGQFYDCYITSLSGGQLRRVSLLVALIHDPDLLILDEPTVGLDPVTRCSLWKYFLRAAEEQNKTILITTHYIEEARKSHQIGLMRGGVLLAESPPEKLLQEFKSSSLEDVFLILSQHQMESPVKKVFPKSKTAQLPNFTRKNYFCNFNRLCAQTMKNFYWMKRNAWLLIYILLLPGMMSFLFCMLHTNNLRGLHIALVPEDFCANHISTEPNCSTDYKISCAFEQLMKDKGFIVSEYADLETGMRAVERGHSLAVLYFSHNYTSALNDIFSSSFQDPPTNETLNDSQIQVTMDMTEKIKARQVVSAVEETFNDVQTQLIKGCGYKTAAYQSLVREPVEVYGADSIDFVQNALPGFLIPLVFFMATSYTSTAVASEKNTGVFQRSLVSGVTKLEMNLAHTVIQLLVLLVQNCVLMVIIYTNIHNFMRGNILLASFLVILAELQGMLYGIFLASIIKKENHLTNTTVGTIMTLFLTSGMIWPIEGMVPALKFLVDYSPLTIAVEAFRSVSIRGWGLDNPRVFSAFRYNLATIVVMMIANILSAKRSQAH